MKKNLRIAYTGGGTGGHIYPLLAVADEVKELTHQNENIEIQSFYFGAPGIYADEFIKRSIRIKKIMSPKLRRYFSLGNIIDLIKLPFAFIQALLKLWWVMPDVLFSKGGTGAFPIVCMAWVLRVPIIVHESDSVPGLTNRLSFPFATRVGVAFQNALTYVAKNKGAVVGNPIRPFLLATSDVTQEQAKRIFGFDPQTPLILVLGGSQGSQRINSFLFDNAVELVQQYQVLHQVGIQNFKEASQELGIIFEQQISPLKSRYKVIDFFTNNLKDAFIAADMVVSRAGSGTLFEIAWFKKPAIIIPLSEAAHNHQWLNASAYEEKGGGILIEEENLKPILFTTQVKKILENKEVYNRMSQSAESFATPYAAAAIAQEILRLVE